MVFKPPALCGNLVFKIYFESSLLQAVGSKLISILASGKGGLYETHLTVLNKYFIYIICCLQLFCVIQKGGSVKTEREGC